MRVRNKYIILTLIAGMMSLNSNTYAMPLQTIKPIPIPNLAKIWETNTMKLERGLALTATPPPTPTPTPKPLYEMVVDKAKEYIGVPYVWGGTFPSGFDCSGLVQYVYKQVGCNLSRTTYTQVDEGIEVNRDNLRQGDLVFFRKDGEVHHVGIYIGNGKYIHAPQTGEVVRVSNLSDRTDYYTARRIICD